MMNNQIERRKLEQDKKKKKKKKGTHSNKKDLK